MLAHCVEGAELEAAVRSKRRDVDNASRTAFQHMPTYFGAGEEDAGEIDADHLVIVGSCELLGRLKHRDALRVDQNVDPSVFGDDTADDVRQRARHRNVGAVTRRGCAPGGKCRIDFGDLACRSPDRNNNGPGVVEPERNLAANAA